MSQASGSWLALIDSSALKITGLRAEIASILQKSVGHWGGEMLLQMLQLAQVERFEVDAADNCWNVPAVKREDKPVYHASLVVHVWPQQAACRDVEKWQIDTTSCREGTGKQLVTRCRVCGLIRLSV